MKTGCKGYDPTVALTGPDSEDINCKVSVSEKDLKQIVLSSCEKLKKPAPGEDPCAAGTGEDSTINIHRYTIGGFNGGLAGNPCNDPRAQCDPDRDRGPTVSIVKFQIGDRQEKGCAISKKINPNVPCFTSIKAVNIGNSPGPAPCSWTQTRGCIIRN